MGNVPGASGPDGAVRCPQFELDDIRVKAIGEIVTERVDTAAVQIGFRQIHRSEIVKKPPFRRLIATGSDARPVPRPKEKIRPTQLRDRERRHIDIRVRRKHLFCDALKCQESACFCQHQPTAYSL